MITITQLSHTHASGVEALRDVSLQVAKGETVAIVGPSGCGKSTLLRAIAGLLTPTAGSIAIGGAPVVQPGHTIGLMFQDAALLPWRSVRDNIALPLELTQQAAPNAASVDAMIDLVGLRAFEHARPATLSGGMAQRTALARALILQPPVLLLDEPFGALDALTRESLTAAFDGIRARTGSTVLLVTHSISEAIFLADRVAVMSARPGGIRAIIEIGLARPRSWEMQRSPAFGELTGRVRDALAAG